MNRSHDISLAQFLAERSPETDGIANIIGGVAEVVQTIARAVRRAGLSGLLGAAGRHNIHGEAVQKLDQFSNQIFLDRLGDAGLLAGIASEEMDDFYPTHSPRAPHLLLIDPLDGSSNIDVNLGIGSIFSIHRKGDPTRDVSADDFFQSGHKQVAAGYAIYGPSTMLVYTIGHGAHGFTLDAECGTFFLSHENIQTPQVGAYYSINEGNSRHWEAATTQLVEQMKQAGRSARYVGALVADFHRNLLKGGLFLYPGDRKNPAGKLRLLYEAAPLAFVAAAAGGAASDGRQSILEIVPTALHQKTGLIIGSAADVKQADGFYPPQQTSFPRQ